MSKFHAICPNCKRVFAKETKDQVYCGYLCEQYFQGKTCPGTSYKQKYCKVCGRGFLKSDFYKYCSNACKTEQNKGSTRLRHEEKIKKANERWLNRTEEDHPLKNVKRKSFKKKIAEMEYQRLYAKDAWDHYIKGRKWDRI